MAKQPIKIEEDSLPIDEFFWFKLSRKWVTNGMQNVIDICERIKTAIAWFFGLGTSGFFISFIFSSETYKGLDLSLIWIPLLLLFISYGLAVMGQTVSLHRDFRPNEHETIRTTYNKVMSRSKFFIIGAALTLMLGLASFPFILIKAAEDKNTKVQPVVEKKVELSGSYMMLDTMISKNNKKHYISETNISGKSKFRDKPLRILVEKGKTFNTRTFVLEKYVQPDTTSGQFFLSIPTAFEKSTTLADKEKVFLACEYEGDQSLIKERLTIEIGKVD